MGVCEHSYFQATFGSNKFKFYLHNFEVHTVELQEIIC